MNIIFEGPDGSGKSTLIQKLYEDKFIDRIYKPSKEHLGPPQNATHFDTRISDRLMSYIFHAETSLMMAYDREPLISEYIYGRLLRGKSYSSIERLISLLGNPKLDYILVLVCPDVFMHNPLKNKDYKTKEHQEMANRLKEDLFLAYVSMYHIAKVLLGERVIFYNRNKDLPVLESEEINDLHDLKVRIRLCAGS